MQSDAASSGAGCQACLGRSRGGLTTKVHLAVDGRGLPLSIVLTPGNANVGTAFGQVLDGIRVPRTTLERVPATRPTPARRSATCCGWPRRHDPERRDQVADRRRRGTHRPTPGAPVAPQPRVPGRMRWKRAVVSL
ncbi:transposase [Streptomyces gardneri]|uniref:transposase n=1 Tax=Streptomyces gardneri TaxID=66892 RepID=UPI0037D5B038